jgi:hypothetical protein
LDGLYAVLAVVVIVVVAAVAKSQFAEYLSLLLQWLAMPL